MKRGRKAKAKTVFPSSPMLPDRYAISTLGTLFGIAYHQQWFHKSIERCKTYGGA